jgi:hypothetical protein
MSCSYDIGTERYSMCDGITRCYCPSCKKCGESVNSQKDLNKDGNCFRCAEHLENKAHGDKCESWCLLCAMERKDYDS